MDREPTHRDLEVALGRLEERIRGMDARRGDRDLVLDARFVELKAESAQHRAELAEIKELMAQGRGGWKVIAAASGVVGTLGALVGAPLVKKLMG